jgi:hypothetical protein
MALLRKDMSDLPLTFDNFRDWFRYYVATAQTLTKSIC